MADWLKIKNEYISTGISYRSLAEKYSVPIDTIKKKAAREHWKDTYTKMAPKVHQKVQEKCIERIATSESNRIARLLSLSDKISDRLGEALDLPNNCDAKGIQQLSAALKNLKDVAAMDTTESDALRKARDLLGGVDGVI